MSVHVFSHSVDEPLCNAYVAPFTVDGATFSSVDDFLEGSMDSAVKAEAHSLQSMLLPMVSARAEPDQEAWEAAMRKGLREKFTQVEGLREKLLATDSAVLVYADHADGVWGSGTSPDLAVWLLRQGLDIPGSNRLGHLLMDLRAQLKAPQ